MQFREKIGVYCENHTEHTKTLCGQNAEYKYVKPGGIYSNHCVLKSQETAGIMKERPRINFMCNTLLHQGKSKLHIARSD
jgi:hypothetical protein